MSEIVLTCPKCLSQKLVLKSVSCAQEGLSDQYFLDTYRKYNVCNLVIKNHGLIWKWGRHKYHDQNKFPLDEINKILCLCCGFPSNNYIDFIVYESLSECPNKKIDEIINYK